MTASCGWTSADQAEQGVLVDAFIVAVIAHRRGCDVCAQGGPWCGRLLDAYGVLVDWHRARRLTSEATWLRARQTLRDFAAVLR